MKYKDVIWDFDGTLFNTYQGMTTALKRALKEFNIDENEKEISAKLEASVDEAMQYY
jgi:phosphoglycolate phosphatase-like HAD superfamily hydrolase